MLHWSLVRLAHCLLVIALNDVYYFEQINMMMIAVNPMFVDHGVKVNGQYYRDILLSHQMIPAIKQVAGDMFVFQQDSAPAHHARDTIQLLQRETPDFIGPDLWPPNSPDLNPVDYKIWGVSSGCMNHASTTSMS